MWSDFWGRVEAGRAARRPVGRPLRWWPTQGQGSRNGGECGSKDVSQVEGPGVGLSWLTPAHPFPEGAGSFKL